MGCGFMCGIMYVFCGFWCVGGMVFLGGSGGFGVGVMCSFCVCVV